VAKPWLIYTRVSTDDQVQGASLDVQRTQCEAMAKATAVSVVDVVVDDGYSGKDTKRPGMRRVLDMVERRELGGIIVWKLDRLTRNLRDLLAMVDLFTATDTALVSLAEKIDTSGPMGRFTLHIMGAVAQLERETIQARVTAAMRHIRAKGGWCGGRVPPGCRIVGERGGRQLERDPATAPAVVAAFRSYVDGASLAQLADQLLATGLTRSRRTPTNVSGLLRDRRLVEAGVVDADLFEAAGATLDARWSGVKEGLAKRQGVDVSNLDRRPSALTNRVWPLRGIAHCGRCGAPLAGASSRGRNGVLNYYLRCTNRARGAGCKLPDLPAEAWEGVVVAAVARAAGDEAWASAWARYAEHVEAAHGPASARRSELQAKRGQIQARIDRLIDFLAEGTGSAAARAKVTALEQEMAQVDADLNRVVGELAGYDILDQRRHVMREAIRLAAEQLPGASLEDKHAILRGVVGRVVFHDDPAAIEVHLYEPGPPEGGRWIVEASRLVQQSGRSTDRRRLGAQAPDFRWPVVVGRVGPRYVLRLGDPVASREAGRRAVASRRSKDLADQLGVSRRQAQRLRAGRATPAALRAVADRLGGGSASN
jgi:site-specific DNA recombinase